MAGWAARDIAHTVLPLHLAAVCDLHFQSYTHNDINSAILSITTTEAVLAFDVAQHIPPFKRLGSVRLKKKKYKKILLLNWSKVTVKILIMLQKTSI